MLQKSFRFFAPALLLCFSAGAALCQSGQWQLVAPMWTGRTALGAATGPDGRIYGMGGYTGYGVQRSMEAYQPQTNTWTTMSSMSTPREYFGCVTGPDGRIYAIGGSWVAAAEAYDTRVDRWSPIEL